MFSSLLSVGQKQRVAIARALLRDPRVLILDEATSSLDVESQHKIQEAVSRLPEQTVMVIAHQLKTVERADQIVVIENGMVVEVGNHSNLIAAEGSYFRLVHKLFSSEGNGQSANESSSSTHNSPGTQ
uniref:ATP-binding cassette sub-family B member 9-like n=1 Tax=Callorhinchus milii TaxID=7868 RepID=A0A4W3GHT8_CALMI